MCTIADISKSAKSEGDFFEKEKKRVDLLFS